MAAVGGEIGMDVFVAPALPGNQIADFGEARAIASTISLSRSTRLAVMRQISPQSSASITQRSSSEPRNCKAHEAQSSQAVAAASAEAMQLEAISWVARAGI